MVTPYAEEFNYHICNQYVIRAKQGDNLKQALKEAGIGVGIYYPVPLHLQKFYCGLGCRQGDLPASEEASKHVLALPIYPELTREQKSEW